MNELEARVAWSGLAEPGDAVAGSLVEVMGAVEALGLVAATARGGRAELPPLGAGAEQRVRRSLEGWAHRWDPEAPAAHRRWLASLGGRVVVPGDGEWPSALDDLGAARPMCLWVRGRSPAALLERAVAVVGARAASPYGEHVTAALVAGLVDAGVCVVSGGAFGVDAAAHRAALLDGGATVAVLAGGLDRPYPAGNARLLAQVAQEGALVSEVPPGTAPSRHRFLLRNRVIAAASGVTVVVEAAWRSGALSTAGHAVGLLRPVGAVPGPVTSAASAGCHRLLREGATCVTDAAEVLELLDGVPAGPAPEADLPGPAERAVLDALPARGTRTAEAVAARAGMAVLDVLAALGRLEAAGRARHEAGSWRRLAEHQRR